MKRSDMLELMAGMMCHDFHHGPDDRSWYSTAEVVLKEMEDRGMLPPPTTREIEGKFTSEFFEWEKE